MALKTEKHADTKTTRRVTAYFNTLHAGRKHELLCSGVRMGGRLHTPHEVPKGLRQYFGLVWRRGIWITTRWKDIDEARAELTDSLDVVIRGNNRGALRITCKAEWYEPRPKAEVSKIAKRRVSAREWMRKCILKPDQLIRGTQPAARAERCCSHGEASCEVTDVLLASLRCYQSRIGTEEAIDFIASGEGARPLPTPDMLDDLCQSINCDGIAGLLRKEGA